MAGFARYTAVLDACVLHGNLHSDALMSLATAELFAAKWSERIEDEWMRSVKRSRPDLADDKVQRRRDAMRAAVPDWEVSERVIAQLLPGLTLPDANDRHVLAAAIAGHADCIVTRNLKDFPQGVLADFGVEALHPDRFIVCQWDLSPYQTISALKKMRARLRGPAMSPEEFADAFARVELTLVAERLREVRDLI